MLPGFLIPHVVAISGPLLPTVVPFNWDNSGTTTIDFIFPATVLNGDIAIGWVFDGSTPTIVAPSGFTAEAQINNGVLGARLMWKRCDGSEGGTTVTVTVTGGADGKAALCMVRNAITTGTPYEGYASANGATNTQTAAAVTTTGVDRLALRFGCLDLGWELTTVPAGWTAAGVSSSSDPFGTVDRRDVPTAQTVAASARSYTSVGQWATATLAILPIP